ncbi:MAG: hypothetical protein R3B70_27715 [Polyangiaceae bacterium]
MKHSPLFIASLFLIAGCGADPAPFSPSSPASTAFPGAQRVKVGTVLEAPDPGDAARSPLLGAPTAAPTMDHSHHHHAH